MRPTDISEKNFRGIEIRDFAAEIARLALVIAEYQCDVQHRGPLAAKAEFLPLDEMNWITCGNALSLDWLKVCPPERTTVQLHSDDLFQTPLVQTAIDFENEGEETFICGNPPYLGSKFLSSGQKLNLGSVFQARLTKWKSLDLVAAWFLKAAEYGTATNCSAAFVSTNSICQGQQVPILWPVLYRLGREIHFAQTSFKWANLASHNAGVTVVIVGLRQANAGGKTIFSINEAGETVSRAVSNISPYLIAGPSLWVEPQSRPISSDLTPMQFGNHPYYGSGLIFSNEEARSMIRDQPDTAVFVRRLYGSEELIKGKPRSCLWVSDSEAKQAAQFPSINARFLKVAEQRSAAKQDAAAQKLAKTPYRFRDQITAHRYTTVVPRVSSENRNVLPVGLVGGDDVVQDQAFALYDAPLWNMALIASRLHLVWIATVCGKLKTDFRYSNTLGWNTFPVPRLTEQNKVDLTRCAEDILLARETHFPDTIADLYDPEVMPKNLHAAHEANDDVLERIYIGRRFRNDTERLEKLFEMYAKMTATPANSSDPAAKRVRKATT